MAQTLVFGCDWCDAIIEKKEDGTPKFAAKISAEKVWPFPPMGEKPKTYDICGECLKAFQALTEGRFRR